MVFYRFQFLCKHVTKKIFLSRRYENAAVYSRLFTKASAFTARYGRVGYTDAALTITTKGVDVVYILAPHNSHRQYAKVVTFFFMLHILSYSEECQVY